MTLKNMPGLIKNIIDILPYPVIVGTGPWPPSPLAHLTGQRFFILVDHNTSRFCLPVLTEKWEGISGAPSFSIQPGERSKNFSTLRRIWNWLSTAGADRDSILINLGGGVVTDLGGFAAGTYQRGIRYINIPTSLMAQADAAVGGKTGINIGTAKNQAGLFYDPVAVIVDPSFLSTLPGRHMENGMAEIIKSAALSGGELWNRVVSQEANRISVDLIAPVLEFKCRIVNSDPFDRSSRQVLNFGHTVGHALEGLSLGKGHKPLLHGEAVAAGMICESYLSRKKCSFPEKDLEMLAASIRSHFRCQPVAASLIDEIPHMIIKDKKSRHGITGFTLLNGIGSPLINQVCAADEVRESLNFYNGLIA